MACWWERKLVEQPLWKTVRRLRRKFELGLPSDPAISLLGINLQNTKPLNQKDTCSLCLLHHYLQQPNYKAVQASGDG